MKQNFKNIVLVINTILLVICLVQISDLKTELQNMRHNTGNQISSIMTNLNNSYSYIEDILEKEASIISNAEWEFGAMDIKAGTVELKAYVIPKEYQPEVTQAFFLCGNEKVAAEFTDGKYTVTMEVSLFEDVNIPAVVFKENGIVRTENLDWHFNLRNDFLPNVYAYMYGTTTYGKTNENRGTWEFNGDVEVDVCAKYIEEFEVENVELIRVLDGKEVECFDITMDAMEAHDSFLYNWNPSYEIPVGSVQEIFVDVTLKGGLVYHSQISRCEMDEQGNPVKDDVSWEGMEASIYDTEGNFLYDVEEMYPKW